MRPLNRFMNLNLRTKLTIIFMMLILIPLSLLGFFSYQKSTNMMQEQMSSGVLDNMKQINKNLSFFARDVEQLSMYIFRNSMVQETLAKPGDRSRLEKYKDYMAMQHLFETVLGPKTWDIRIYIIGLNGDRYFTGDFLPTQYDKYNENWGIFRKANQASGTIVWDTHYNVRKIDPQEVVLSAGRQLKDIQTDEKLGYLIIEILEPSLAGIYRTDRDQGEEQMFLLDSQGYIISSYPDKATVGTRMEFADLNRILSGREGYFQTKWHDKRHILVYDTGEEAGFKMVKFVPMDQIVSKNSLIRNITFTIAAIGLFVSVWLAYFLSKTVTKPLEGLIQLMKKVEIGRLDVRFPTKYTDDIGILGRSFNRMTQRLRELIQEVYEKQVRLKDAELKALQAQITPHFLYNTLETVNWMAKMKGVPDISRIVVSLAEMLRHSVKKEKELVLIQEEITQLEHYLTIQQIRYRDRFQVFWQVDDEALNCQIPSLMLQPLVENAITHGLEMKLEEGTLRIAIQVIERKLQITITDDGVGIEAHVLQSLQQKQFSFIQPRHTGIGLENVVRRLDIYYNGEADMIIDSEQNQGTSITIKLPIHRTGEGLT